MNKTELITAIITLLALSGAEEETTKVILNAHIKSELQIEHDRLAALKQEDRNLSRDWYAGGEDSDIDTVEATIVKVDAKLVAIGGIAPTYNKRREWRVLVFETATVKKLSLAASVYQVDHIEVVKDEENQDVFVTTGDGCRLEIGEVYEVEYYVGVGERTHAIDVKTGEIIPFSRDQLRMRAWLPSGGTVFTEEYEANRAVIRAAAKAKAAKAEGEANAEQFTTRLGNVQKAISAVGETVASSPSFQGILDNLGR